MSEECLFLSVYRPRPNFMTDFVLGGAIIPSRKVLVYFVGDGTYERGTIFNQLHDARHLTARDLVVVVVQYRVGPFGFLYGGTKDAPGNLGLWDQILALRWVYYNIARFGGDHNQVTIMGSVGSLILSPLNYRLFRRAILMSGSPLWGVTNKTEALAKTNNLASKLDCPVGNINDTLSCLRNKTMPDILNATKDAFSQNQVFMPIYGDELLPLKPSQALKDGKFNLNFDLFYGVTENEGLDFVSKFVPDEAQLSVQSAKESIKWMMVFSGKNYGEEVAQFYTQNLNETATSEDLKSVIANVWADYTIVCPTILFAEAYAKKSPRKYYYSFRFQSPRNWQDSRMYLFAGPSDKRFTQADLKLSKDFLQAVTSFARAGWVRGWYGKVPIYWGRAFETPTEPVTKYMSLNLEDYKMVSGFYNQTCNGFWKDKLFEDDEK